MAEDNQAPVEPVVEQTVEEPTGDPFAPPAETAQAEPAVQTEPPAWNKKVEEQGYELANLRRELQGVNDLKNTVSKIEGMLQGMQGQGSQNQQDEAEALLSDLNEISNEDEVQGSQLKKVTGRMLSLMKKIEQGQANRQDPAEDLRQTVSQLQQNQQAQQSFSSLYPNTAKKHSHQELSDKAWERVQKAGYQQGSQEAQIAANFALQQMCDYYESHYTSGKAQPAAATPPKAPGSPTTGANPVQNSTPPPPGTKSKSEDQLRAEVAEMWSEEIEG